MAQTYLITGGSGFLGINLVRHLLSKGERVVSLDLVAFDYPEKDRITHFVGDIRNKEDVARAMEGVNVVVHTAAALPLYTAEEIRSTDVEGTHNMLAAAREHNVERFIHVSSTAVYGIPDHHPLYEEDNLDGVGEYGKAKISAELLCVEYRELGMCITIIRPKTFVGPERLGVFAMFYDWASTGHNFPMLGDGSNRYQLLDVEDLCEAIYLAANAPREVANQTFNIGAKEFGTMREDYQAVLDRADFGKKVIGLPATPAIWTLRFLERLHLSPLYKWVYETASKDSFVSIEKAEKLLGYKPKFSNKQALLRNYEWYLANRESFSKQSGISHRVPWKQGILGFAKVFF